MNLIKVTSNNIEDVKELSQKYNFEINRNWDKLIDEKDVEIYLLVEKEEVIGFTGLIHNDWNETLQILDIFIDPKYRSKGYGKFAINSLLDKAKIMNKYRCVIAEAPAKDGIDKFYSELGFRKCGYNDRYYTNENNGDIAIFMSYDLK